MIRNTKAKGSHNERRSMRLLESLGYRCTKSGASLGAWDLIGIGACDVVLVQVKTNRWPSTAERTVMRAFVTPPGVRKIIHRWNDYAREPVTEAL